MRKKGFTLIELLAVIVILAIIALIATPIILGIINDAKEESNKRSVELYANEVKNAVVTHQMKNNESITGTYDITPEGNICLAKNEFGDCIEELKIQVDGTKLTSGTVTIYKDGNIYIKGGKLNGSDEECNYGKTPCTLNDVDKDGKASLSDIITCGTENFYVMYNENEEITMLSKYNLHVGYSYYSDGTINNGVNVELENPTGIQNELAKGLLDDYTSIGGVAFSSTNYWETGNYSPAGNSLYKYVYDNNSTIYNYVNNYENYLIGIGISTAKATLISYEEIMDLKENKGNPQWLYVTCYWTGSASDDKFIHCVCPGGVKISNYNSRSMVNDRYYYHYDTGIRPVITISSFEI